MKFVSINPREYHRYRLCNGVGLQLDRQLRARMVQHMESVSGFDATLRQPPYPGKSYGGVVAWPFS